MAGIRGDEKQLADWKRKAKAAQMSLQRWAALVLDSAPEVQPASLKRSA